MKKFMKAIAFATVMCMLLSTVAFAAASDIVEGKVTVTVEHTGVTDGEQLALIATKATVASAAAITKDDILDIKQIAFASGTATAELGTKTETSVKIFYGYQSAGVDSAQFFEAGVAQVEEELKIVLNGDIVVIPDAAADPRYVGEPIAQSDKGALVYATVSFENYDNEVVTNIGWQFINADAEKRIDYPVSGLQILDGDVQVGVAFTNGNGKDRAAFVTEDTTVNLWFKFADNLLMAE